jgi:hypothetical protein
VTQTKLVRTEALAIKQKILFIPLRYRVLRDTVPKGFRFNLKPLLYKFYEILYKVLIVLVQGFINQFIPVFVSEFEDLSRIENFDFFGH